MEYYQTNPEIVLFPPKDPSRVITSFNEIPDNIKADSIRTMELLRNMPNQIISIQGIAIAHSISRYFFKYLQCVLLFASFVLIFEKKQD